MTKTGWNIEKNKKKKILTENHEDFERERKEEEQNKPAISWVQNYVD
jgi:hypothetical protein